MFLKQSDDTMKQILQLKKFIFVFLSLLFLCMPCVHAQERFLKGRVTDQTGEPMIGVTVVNVNDANKSTITDLDGNYSIKVKNSTILKFSYIGFKTKAVNVSQERTTLNVEMEEETIMLEQTVVVGMNIKRDEKSLSTAFQKLDVEGLTETRDASFLNMLSF